jgi:phosphoserine phosphatase RsbU/P
MPDSLECGLLSRPPSRATRGRVLVVDDDGLVRAYLRQLIEAWGYDCGEAPDGVAALRCLQCQPVSLLLTDYEMPRLNGLDLLRTLSAAALATGTSMVPAVVLSGGLPADAARGLMAAGARAILLKPVHPGRLRQTLDRLHL